MSFFTGFVTGLLTAPVLLVWLVHHALGKKQVGDWLKAFLKDEPPPEERKVE